jgi:hypothetical protein
MADNYPACWVKRQPGPQCFRLPRRIAERERSGASDGWPHIPDRFTTGQVRYGSCGASVDGKWTVAESCHRGCKRAEISSQTRPDHCCSEVPARKKTSTERARSHARRRFFVCPRRRTYCVADDTVGEQIVESADPSISCADIRFQLVVEFIPPMPSELNRHPLGIQ